MKNMTTLNYNYKRTSLLFPKIIVRIHTTLCYNNPPAPTSWFRKLQKLTLLSLMINLISPDLIIYPFIERNPTFFLHEETKLAIQREISDIKIGLYNLYYIKKAAFIILFSIRSILSLYSLYITDNAVVTMVDPFVFYAIQIGNMFLVFGGFLIQFVGLEILFHFLTGLPITALESESAQTIYNQSKELKNEHKSSYFKIAVVVVLIVTVTIYPLY